MNAPSHEDVAALRSQLHSNGYRPVAVYTQGKRPFGNAWQDRARQNPPGAVTEPVNDAALSTGILCDGLRAIDIDVDDPAIASEVERIAYGILGTCPARRRADSARALLLYRAASGEPSKRTIEGTLGSVEALGHGQQFCAFGTYEQGQPYTWAVSPAPYSVNALTAITEEALTAFLGAVTALIGSQAIPPAPVAPTGIVVAPVNPALVTDADRAYALAALQDEYAKLCAVTSSRNNAINAASHALGTLVANGSLNEADAFSALFEAATMNGYTQKPDGINRATKTIYSGLTSGKAKPRPLPSQTVPVLNPELRASIVAKNRTVTTPQPSPTKRYVELARMAEVSEKPITWLWHSYLPLGKLTLLAGAGGTGKSTLAFSMASIVTTAGMWPDATRCNVAGNVLIWSSEDDPADVIKPRLLAMNADVGRVGMIRATMTEASGEAPFDPARDMDALKDAARAIGGVSLLIIDPIVSAVSGDMHKANDVRRSLQAIVDFAAEMNCAVIGITHFAKSTAGRNPSERVIGSQAFAAFARNIHTPAGLDAFVDYLDSGTPIILADMGAGAGQVAADWFDSMFEDVAATGARFTAVGVVTPDPASVESVLAWASRLQERVEYAIVENATSALADFTYWRSTEQANRFREVFAPEILRMEFRLAELENPLRQHGIQLGQVADRKAEIDELKRASLVMRAQSYRRRLFSEFDRTRQVFLP